MRHANIFSKPKPWFEHPKPNQHSTSNNRPCQRGYEDAFGHNLGPMAASAASNNTGDVIVKKEVSAEDEMAKKIQWLITNVESQTHRYLDIITNAKLVQMRCEKALPETARYLTPLQEALKLLIAKAQKLANLLTKMQTQTVNTAEMPKVIRLKEEIDRLETAADDAAKTWGLVAKKRSADDPNDGGGGGGTNKGKGNAKKAKKLEKGEVILTSVETEATDAETQPRLWNCYRRRASRHCMVSS